MTGLNEFKELVAMERKSIEHTLPFWAGDYNYDMVRYEKLDLMNLTASKKSLKGA